MDEKVVDYLEILDANGDYLDVIGFVRWQAEDIALAPDGQRIAWITQNQKVSIWQGYEDSFVIEGADHVSAIIWGASGWRVSD